MDRVGLSTKASKYKISLIFDCQCLLFLLRNVFQIHLPETVKKTNVNIKILREISRFLFVLMLVKFFQQLHKLGMQPSVLPDFLFSVL